METTVATWAFGGAEVPGATEAMGAIFAKTSISQAVFIRKQRRGFEALGPRISGCSMENNDIAEASTAKWGARRCVNSMEGRHTREYAGP